MRADLDRTREDDVRVGGRMLYPGLEVRRRVAAVRMLLRRLPTGIATHLEIEALREIDEPGNSMISESDRLLVVRIVEEGVTNALRRGHATQFRLETDVVDGAVLVHLSNSGDTVDKARLGQGSVLARLRERPRRRGTVVLTDDLHRPGADLTRTEEAASTCVASSRSTSKGSTGSRRSRRSTSSRAGPCAASSRPAWCWVKRMPRWRCRWRRS